MHAGRRGSLQWSRLDPQRPARHRTTGIRQTATQAGTEMSPGQYSLSFPMTSDFGEYPQFTDSFFSESMCLYEHLLNISFTPVKSYRPLLRSEAASGANHLRLGLWSFGKQKLTCNQSFPVSPSGNGKGPRLCLIWVHPFTHLHVEYFGLRSPPKRLPRATVLGPDWLLKLSCGFPPPPS